MAGSYILQIQKPSPVTRIISFHKTPKRAWRERAGTGKTAKLSISLFFGGKTFSKFLLSLGENVTVSLSGNGD